MKKHMHLKSFVFSILLFSLFLTSVAYSAFATSLAITSDATFRASADIRITSISLSNTENGALVQYESEYTINTITTGFVLPNSDSSITYKVTVKNFGDVDQTIYDITKVFGSDNVYYEILNYKEKDVIKFNSEVIFYVKFKTSTPSTDVVNYKLNFNYKKVYYVSYDESLGSSKPETQIKYENIDLNLTDQIMKNPGYAFKGWSNEKNSNIVKYSPGDIYDKDENIILYPVWELEEYTLTVNPNGGKWNDSFQIQKFKQYYGTTLSINIPDINDYYLIEFDSNNVIEKEYESTKAYRSFIGWSLEGSGTLTNNKPIETSNQIYIFGSSNGTLTANYNNESLPINLPVIEKEGYTCAWNEQPDGNGVKYESGKTNVIITSNKTLYAICNPNKYFIKYNKGNSTSGSVPETQNVTYGSTITLSSNELIKEDNDGYTLTYGNGFGVSGVVPSSQTQKVSYIADGWSNTENGTKTYESEQSLDYYISSDLNLYPSWIENRKSIEIAKNEMIKERDSLGKITFNYNDGKTENTIATGYIDYNANGWTTKIDGSTKEYDDNSLVVLTSDMTIYPCFAQTRIGAQFPVPTRLGYTFDGWYTSETGGEKLTSYIDQEDITLYAHWSINKYKLSVNPNGGVWNGSTSIQQFTQDYGTTKVIDNPTTNAYYTIKYNANGGKVATGDTLSYRNFIEWTKSGKENFDNNNYTFGPSDGTLTASYNSTGNSITTKNASRSYKITYNLNSSGATSSNTSGSDTITYTMNGWYTASTNGTKRAANGGSYSPTSSETLYAQWKSNSITLPTITKTGYTCTWNTKADGTGTSYASGQASYTTSANTTLYTICKDTTAPTAPTLSVTSGTASGYNNNWYKSNVVVKITAGTDRQSGVSKVTYLLSGATTKGETTIPSGNTITISKEGSTTITAYTYDNAGNKSAAKKLVINIDKTAPTDVAMGFTDNIGINSGYYIIRVSAADATSGIRKYAYSVDGGTSWVQQTSNSYKVVFTANFSHSVKVRVYDNAGHITESGAASMNPKAVLVRQLYEQMLGREPEQSGYDYWRSISNCAQIAYGISEASVPSFNSNYTLFVKTLYKGVLGREETTASVISGHVNTINTSGVSTGIRAFTNSAEFHNICTKYGLTWSTF